MSCHAWEGKSHSMCSTMCDVGAFPCIVNVWPAALSSQATCLNGESTSEVVCHEKCNTGCSSVNSDPSAGCGSAAAECMKFEEIDTAGSSHGGAAATNAVNANCLGTSDTSADIGSTYGLEEGCANVLRKKKGGLSAALKEGVRETGFAASATHGHARPASPDAQRSAVITAQIQRPAAARAHESAVAAAMQELGRGRGSQSKAMLPSNASDANDAPGIMGSSYGDSLPCFSPSLVDRLWAGRSSDGSSSPRVRHFPKQAQVQQPRQQQQPQQQTREGRLQKFSHTGQKPQPPRCLGFPLLQQHLQQQQPPRNGSAPLHRSVPESGASTPIAASADTDLVLSTRATPTFTAAAVRAPQPQQPPARMASHPTTGLSGALAAAAACVIGSTAAAVKAAALGTSAGRPLLSGAQQAAAQARPSGPSSALTAAAAAAAGNGRGLGVPAELAVGRMPCMALVAAAAAAAAAPRALGDGAVAAGAGSANRNTSGSTRGGAPDARRLPPKPPSAPAPAPAAAAVPPQSNDGRHPLPVNSARNDGAPVSLADVGQAPSPLPPLLSSDLDLVNTAAAIDSGGCAGADPVPDQPQPAHSTAAATLIAQAMSAYEAPRGHVHNGPRMPLGTAGTSPPSATCSLRPRRPSCTSGVPPQPPPLRLSRLSACGCAGGSQADGLDTAEGAATNGSCRRSDDPWVACRVCHGPDSPVSQVSTEWEPRTGVSPTASAVSGGGVAAGAGWQQQGRDALGRNFSQMSLCGTDILAPEGDPRTQWWGRELGGGLFHDGDNATLCARESARSPSKRRQGGGAGGNGARKPWWQWLLPGV